MRLNGTFISPGYMAAVPKALLYMAYMPVGPGFARVPRGQAMTGSHRYP